MKFFTQLTQKNKFLRLSLVTPNCIRFDTVLVIFMRNTSRVVCRQFGYLVIMELLRCSAHLGSPPRERKVHFEVCFTAGFSGKIVNSSMNEVYHTGATREAAYSHCTMVNYSRKRVTQNPRFQSA